MAIIYYECQFPSNLKEMFTTDTGGRLDRFNKKLNFVVNVYKTPYAFEKISNTLIFYS